MDSGTTVTISTATSGCGGYIKHTEDGSTPSSSNGTTGTSVVITSTTTLKAAVIGCPSYSDSPVASSTYNVAATPIYSPTDGPHFTQEYVEPSCSTASSSIYYTTNGTTPTTSSTLWVGTYEPSISSVSNSGAGSLNGAYYWAVSSTNAAGESALSTAVQGPSNSSYKATVSWAAVTNATGYKVYRGTTASNALLVAPTASTSYVDDGTITPSGSPQTYNATAIATGTSGTFTLKSICTASGYGQSAVATGVFVIDPADSAALVSDPFTAYFDSGLSGDKVPMYPLDDIWTNGAWKMNGTALTGGPSLDVSTSSLTQYIGVASARDCTGTSGYCIGLRPAGGNGGPGASGGNGTINFITYGGGTLGNDQWAQVKYRGGDVGPGGRCSTSGALTGYATYFRASGTAYLYRIVNGTATQLASAAVAPSAGWPLEIRIIGSTPTYIQVKANGSVVSGLSYTDNSPILSGGPCPVALGTAGDNLMSDFTAGGVGNSTYSANSYTPPSHTTFSDAANTSGWAPMWPWWWGANWNALPPFGAWTSKFAVKPYSGGYGIGLDSAGGTQYELRRPTSANQYTEATITVAPDDVRLNNWFMLAQHMGWIPGLYSGRCIAHAVLATCFDEVSYYNGVQTVTSSMVHAGQTTCAGNKDPYNCTPFLHVTKVTPAASAEENDVISVVGSFYTPVIGDKVHVEYVDGHVRGYCWGHGANPSWAANTAVSVGYMITDANGNLQIVTQAGTTGAGPHPTWGTTWDVVTRGAITNDNTAKWSYYGEPCATNSGWSMVYNAYDADMLGNTVGKPGLWLDEPYLNGQADWAPAFNNISAGDVTNGGLCTTLPSGCGTAQSFISVIARRGEQPEPWMARVRSPWRLP